VRFDLETGEWYFVNGNQTANLVGFYSTLGNGYPGARFYISMSLLSNNSIILFAGEGYTIGVVFGYLNELWRFDTPANDWYFVEGNETIDVYGVTSTSGNGYPGSRYSHTFSTLSNNSIILFAGNGYAINDNSGPLNELWRYDTHLCPCTNGYCDPSNETNCVCDSDYFGQNCEYKCTCDNGKCDNGTFGTGLCSNCDPNYFGPNCNETCSCVTGICDDGINGTGICVTQSSSSSSESPSSSSSGNTPTSSTSSKSSITSSKPATTTEHVNTEKSNISKLLPTIFIFIFFFN